MELCHANYCIYKIRYQIIFIYEVSGKIILDNDIINYLKYIFFEIGKRYFFEFDIIGKNGGNVHLFVGAEPK
jgi:putative transposase